jgi:hypothetical protein
MKRALYHALDECLALLRGHQATMEECLARYPQVAGDLRPLLGVALAISALPRLTASPTTFAAGKRRMLEALAEKKRHQATPSALRSLFTRRSATTPSSPSGESTGLAAWKRGLALPVALAAVLALALFAIGRTGFQSPPGGAVVQAATLDAIRGTVQVSPAGSDAWASAAAGERIQAGDRIRTGPLSAATLVFFDGSATDLLGQAEVAILQMSSSPGGGRTPGVLTRMGVLTPTGVLTRMGVLTPTGVLTRIVLRQTLGQTYSRVQRVPDPASCFEIETPSAITTVHGTEFAVAVEASGATHVTVVAGQVEVTAQKTTVAVLAGQETIVRPQRPPSPPASTLRTTPTSSPPPTATTIAPQPSAPLATGTAEIHNPQSATPQPPGWTETPQPSGQAETSQPPGQGKTHQPPGQTRTPPGQVRTPPGQARPHKPPRKP